MEYFYLALFCILLFGVLALTVLLSGYLLFWLVDRKLRRCPNCLRSAAGTIIDSETEPLGAQLDRTGKEIVRVKSEKVIDHYQCKYCGHTWTHSFQRKERAPVRGTSAS